MKIVAVTQTWARKCVRYLFGYVALFMCIVSLSMPMIDERIITLWLTLQNLLFLQFLPLLSIVIFAVLWQDLKKRHEIQPFFLSLSIFLMNYIGLGISIWPWLVPFAVSSQEADTAPELQSLLLAGMVVLLPVVLTYMGYCYYIFRGKSSHETFY